MSALLSVSDVHISYGKVEAVRGVSLDVADNEIVTRFLGSLQYPLIRYQFGSILVPGRKDAWSCPLPSMRRAERRPVFSIHQSPLSTRSRRKRRWTYGLSSTVRSASRPIENSEPGSTSARASP